MTLQIHLSPQLEDRLRREADRKGLSPEAVTLTLLDQHLPSSPEERKATALALLQQWTEEDACLSLDKAAENAGVLRALDEDRPSHRKLFTDVLKDSPP